MNSKYIKRQYNIDDKKYTNYEIFKRIDETCLHDIFIYKNRLINKETSTFPMIINSDKNKYLNKLLFFIDLDI
jgi:hypothetical protein